jgi:predicted site-specific integrase-resolvase
MNEEAKYITIKKATKMYGITSSAFRKWDREGILKSCRTPGNIRIYDKADIEKTLNINRNGSEKKRYIYCRVSSEKQRNDLERQEEFLRSMYPEYDIIKDVGSGINFKRKGLRTILERSIKGLVEEVVVAYKDRLARFGFDIIEFIINKGGGQITVLNNEKHKSTEQELSEDLLAIIHVFNCKQMGRRRYCIKEPQNKVVS